MFERFARCLVNICLNLVFIVNHMVILAYISKICQYIWW